MILLRHYQILLMSLTSDHSTQTCLSVHKHDRELVSLIIIQNIYVLSLGPYNSRIFVTIPRFDEGRPMTLGIVDGQGRIQAYPDYSWHDNQGQNCDGITSVFRVAVCIILYYSTSKIYIFVIAISETPLTQQQPISIKLKI